MILVTGGAGFIGANFVLDWLRSCDEPVVNLDALTYAGNLENLASLQGDARHIFVHGDICDRELIDRLLAEHQPRAIVHFAAESHVDRSIHGPGDFIRTNVNGTFTLLEAARGHWMGLDAEAKAAFGDDAVYLEKYLVTITGLAAFKLLIPIGCILLSLCFGFKKDLGRTIACKLVLFGLAVYLVVPVSVRVADLIDATYGASMENTIASAKQATDEIKGEADTQSQESSGSDTGGKSSFWSGLVDKVEDTVTGAKVNLENTLNRFIEAIAVMLVTSCVIPILVLLFFVWLVKLVLGVNITLPQIGKKKKEGKRI